jgi:hypothetical protein
VSAQQAPNTPPDPATSRQVIDLVVHVTAEHIRAGTAADCHRCPIALALVDALPTIGWEVHGYVPVAVGVDMVDVWDNTAVHYVGRLSHQVCDFIDRFDRDRGGPCDPFQFNLRLRRAQEPGDAS